MTDGKIEFKTSIDTDGVKKGIKEIDSALQGIANVDIKVDKSKINKATKEVKTFSDNLDEASDNAKDFAKSNKEANDSVDSLGEKLDKANKSTSATSKGFAGLGNTLKTGIQNAGGFAFSITNIANAGKLAADVMKKVAAAVAECTAAYRTQKQAETQLEAAAKNNPMLNGRSVAQLKEFASSVQRVSTVGDEQLLPLMAQLAAAGRTQEEIQQIIKTSVDVAASGAMSLESAVKNLNKTYSGLSGELGESIPQIKALTAEELKQGKAIEVVAKQYKGMAEETTKATGTAQQLSNAWGDFKEELGAPFEKALAPMRQFFSEFLSNVAGALSARRQLKEAYADLETGNVDEADLDTLKADYQKKQEKYNKTKAQKESQYSFQYGYKVSDEMKARSLANDNELNKQLKEMSSLKAQIDEAEKKLNQSKTAATIAAGKVEAQAKAAQQQAEAETARQTANDKAASAYAQYDKTIAAKKEEIRWRKECGEAITEEAEKQEMLDTQMSAWLTMIESSEGTISGTKGKAASILTQIKADYAEVQEIIASNEASEAAKLEAEKALQEYKSAIEGFASEVNRVYETTLTPGQALDAQINDMRAKYEQLTNDEKYLATLSKDERIQLEQEYTEAYAELCRQR